MKGTKPLFIVTKAIIIIMVLDLAVYTFYHYLLPTIKFSSHWFAFHTRLWIPVKRLTAFACPLVCQQILRYHRSNLCCWSDNRSHLAGCLLSDPYSLQSVTNIPILSCNREHAEQGNDENVEKLRKSDTDDDCFYHYQKWFRTLDWGSMRSNLVF